MIEMDDSQVREAFAQIIGRINNPELLYDFVGSWQKTLIKERIEKGKVSPDGLPWVDLQPETWAHRKRKGTAYRGILYDEGSLLNSIDFSTALDGATIGSVAGKTTTTNGGEYAVYHQFGEGNNPTREFLGWTPADGTYLANTATEYIMNGELKPS